jgi:hypothetical protein
MPILSWLVPTLLVAACYRGSTNEATKPTGPSNAAVTADHVRAMVRRFVDAVGRGDNLAVRGMLDESVRLGTIDLKTEFCVARFGEEQTITEGDRLDSLASCLAELHRDVARLRSTAVSNADQRWYVDLVTECVSFELELTAQHGALVVGAIASKITCDGIEGGVAGGVVGGAVGGNGPLPPPPPPGTPQSVPPTLLESYRIAGSKLITPDDDTKTAISQGTKDKFIGSFKLCIDDAGNIAQIRMLKSTGLPAYDAKLQREMAKWRYKPYLVNGNAVPVCTAITFIYSQH